MDPRLDRLIATLMLVDVLTEEELPEVERRLQIRRQLLQKARPSLCEENADQGAR